LLRLFQRDYNAKKLMKTKQLHSWQVSPEEAREVQLRLAEKVAEEPITKDIRLIAGVDVSARSNRGVGRGAVVVLSYPSLKLVEASVAETELFFPYVPGLLSFREAPVLLEAFAALENGPDLIIVDGQGIAHPRRMGLAAHLGLLLDTPAIGCAKSRLIGDHEPVGEDPGDWAELRDGTDVIGSVVRTKRKTKPLFISIGHKTDLESARDWVLRSCRGYRLPEPTRLAHQAAGGTLKVGAALNDRRSQPAN
jgi:deoxyribonuclease V